MSDMLGLSVESMNTLIAQFQRSEGEIDGIITGIDQQVQSVQWQGQDAERFKGTEWPDAKTKLTQVKQAFEQVRTNLKSQLDAQQSTSGT